MMWFTSDTHFGHARIIDLCARPFADVQEMNDAIVDSFSEVAEDDFVVHLGDVALGGWKQNLLNMKRIPGRKILVAGNHDAIHPMDRRHSRSDVIEAFEDVFNMIFTSMRMGSLMVSHFPFEGDSQDEDRHSEWRPQDQEWITGLIHGHVHDAWKVNLSGDTPQINVGWDVWRRPVSLDEIQWHIDTA